MATTQQSTTKQDILEYLLKHSQGKASQLAAALDVTPQAIRRHLKDLETEGLVFYSSAVQAGMGRPQHLYELSHKGKERLRREVADGYGDFAISLLDTIAETVGKEQVSSILKKQWERKAEEYREQLGDASLRERVAALVKLRRAEGYMAEFHPVAPSETQKGGESHRAATSAEHRFLFLEHNCAISNVAESFPSVCGHELEMFAAVLPDCTVERTQWIINGEHRCGYLVQAREEE